MKRIITLISIILIVSESFSQWNKISIGAGSDLKQVFFADSSTGWVVGYNPPLISKTTNAGLSWNAQLTSTFNPVCVFFINQQTGWVGGTSDTILYTTNGGVNWSTQILPGMIYTEHIFFVNPQTGWVVGSARICKTTNAGSNWISLGDPNSAIFQDVFFLDTLNGFITGTDRTILKTTDGGTSFITQSNQSGGVLLQSIFLTSALTGWCGGGTPGPGILLKTTNGGSNWDTLQYDPFRKNIRSLHFTNLQNGWLVGENGMILYTTNGGSNWNVQQSGTFHNLYSICFTSSQTAFIAGDSGIVLKTTNGGLSFLNKISLDLPASFSLSQNFPNPFNPSTSIKFNIPKSSFVQLTIYDVLGKEVTKLVNKELKIGSYSIDWNGSNYSSGVYFYKLQAGDFTQTKIMMLLK